jgi:predicted ATPase/class 3 adenylate cyclase
VERPSGYLLRVEPEQLDLVRFEELIAEARSSGDEAAALDKLREALALWRGSPLPELASRPSAQAEIARLEQLRTAAIEHQTELEGAVRRQPAPEGRAPAEGAPAGEVRKTVTVVFSDLVDSTGLAARLDPEAFRRLITLYFDSMRAVVERHDGTVEKFIGDAVMAIFGVPHLHEDDALRAVRAAAEMRDRLGPLNDEIEQTFGVRLAARIGVNTGEVVAGDLERGDLIVTGPVVNVAKRLEEAADANEIVIGKATQRLVRNAALLEPIHLDSPKESAPARAWRLVTLLPAARAETRRLDAPLVGRVSELALLRQAFDRASVGSGHFVTVLGAAGVGKSRLVSELVSDVGDEATTLRGRCLPYGEGITYWPLAELVRDAVGQGLGSAEESVAAIAAQLPGEPRAEVIAERVAETLGVVRPGAARSEETFWAVRKLFEALARRRPLVVVFEDLHWAEPTLLDLVEYVADTRGVPLLLICISRPELLERRPRWGGGKLNATTISLEPLRDVESRQLIANLLDRLPLTAEAETRIVELAEGNPLFTEELVSMLIDDDLLRREGDRWIAAADLSELPVPPSIHTLLAARIDRLPDEEQALLVRASVEGTVFHRSVVTETAAGMSGSAIDRALAALFQKDLIRRDRGSFAGEEAFRFRHVLIRDAAYRSLSKQMRAELHQQCAGWLERTAGERVREYEEILGYHLEQTYCYRRELQPIDERLRELGAEASTRLESAGRRALARSDLPAAIGLLDRATKLLADDGPRRARLLPELGSALIEAGGKEQVAEAAMILAEARRLAAAAQDECADAHALVQQQLLRVLGAEDGAMEDAAQAVQRVVPVFERHGDQHGLCRARRLEALLYWNTARAGSAAEAWEQAATHARLAGDEEERSEILSWVASSLFFGPTPVPEAIRRCEEIRVEVGANPGSEAWTLRSLAGLYAMDGRFESARELLAAGNATFEELGQTRNSSVSDIDGIVEILAGDFAAAERRLRAGYSALEKLEDRAFLPTTAAHLAQALYEQGRDDDARRFTQISESLAASDDLLTQVVWRSVRARILAGEGRMDEADKLALEAVAIGESTDFLNTRAGAAVDLAEIRRQAGRLEEAGTAAAEALALYEQKRNRVAAEKTRDRFAVLLRV